MPIEEIQTTETQVNTEVSTIEAPVDDKPSKSDYAKAVGTGAGLMVIGYGLCELVHLGKRFVKSLKKKKEEAKNNTTEEETN